MKNSIFLALAALSSVVCSAQESGRVISTTPVVQQVAVPRQVCSTESVALPAQRSGAGAALGALAGGAVGNSIGQGGGRAVATMIGIFGGAVLGDRVEGRPDAQYQNVQRCSTLSTIENRVSYYSVVYEYGGRQYSVQMPYDPGPQIRLQVTPVDAAPASAPIGAIDFAPSSNAQPIYNQPIYPESGYAQPIYNLPAYPQPMYEPVPAPIYPRYYQRPYAPSIGINFQFGYGSGHRGHRDHHGHWR